LKLFLDIVGAIGFILWIPTIIKWIVSFWFMRNAGLKALFVRRLFSIDEMKVINDLLLYKEAIFFRMFKSATCKIHSFAKTDIYPYYPVIHDKANDCYYSGDTIRAATPKEKVALHRLVVLGYLRLDPSEISYNASIEDEYFYWGGAYITDLFRCVFDFWR